MIKHNAPQYVLRMNYNLAPQMRKLDTPIDLTNQLKRNRTAEDDAK